MIIRAGVRSPPLCPVSAAALDPCRPIGSLVSQEQKVDQNHLLYPQLSVMAGATAGVLHRGGRWPIETSIRDVFPRSSSDEHLAVDTRFPFSPSGVGALRDVAYFRGLFVLHSGQVRDGSHVSERERERASCSSPGLFLSAPFLPVLPQCSHASSFDDVTAQAREGHGRMPPLRKKTTLQKDGASYESCACFNIYARGDTGRNRELSSSGLLRDLPAQMPREEIYGRLPASAFFPAESRCAGSPARCY